MFPQSGQSLKYYVWARDERIRWALARYEKHRDQLAEKDAKRVAVRVILCALSTNVLAPLVMIKSAPIGLSLFVLGGVCFLLGIFMSLQAEHFSGKTLCECFAQVDSEHPELVQAMRKHKAAGLYEEWGGDDI